MYQLPGRATPTQLAQALASFSAAGHVVNFYASDRPCCPDPSLDDDPAGVRLQRITAHLRATASSPLVLIGEAAGWRGARQSGVAFTAPANVRGGGMREASATVVQAALAQHRLAVAPRLFNAYPWHPHRPGQPRSNLAPTAAELGAAQPMLRAAVGDRLVIAVGRKAAQSWQQVSSTAVLSIGAARASAAAVAIRHPSFGGASVFRIQLAAALRHFGLSRADLSTPPEQAAENSADAPT